MNIKIFDNHHKTVDRYTVVFLDSYSPNTKNYLCLCMGLDYWAYAIKSSAWLESCGDAVITFDSLPQAVQDKVRQAIIDRFWMR
jgi:hypothetical protein